MMIYDLIGGAIIPYIQFYPRLIVSRFTDGRVFFGW